MCWSISNVITAKEIPSAAKILFIKSPLLRLAFLIFNYYLILKGRQVPAIAWETNNCLVKKWSIRRWLNEVYQWWRQCRFFRSMLGWAAELFNLVRIKRIFYGFPDHVVSVWSEATLLLEKADSEIAEFSAPVSAYLDKLVVGSEVFSQSKGVIQDLHRCSWNQEPVFCFSSLHSGFGRLC